MFLRKSWLLKSKLVSQDWQYRSKWPEIRHLVSNSIC